MNFFKKWIADCQKDSPLAYDVTSFSTYAKAVTDTVRGCNRDGDKLPQINLGCYLSYQNGMPLFEASEKRHMRSRAS
jgi:transposase